MRKTWHASTLLPILLLAFILLLWFVGGISFQGSAWPFSGIFGSVSDLQNVFSPISALFTGVAAWGAIYAIYAQIQLSSKQQFENVFFGMLTIHNENRRNMRFSMQNESSDSNEYIIGEEAFLKLYDLLKTIYSYTAHSAKHGSHDLPRLSQDIRADIDDNLDQSRDEDEKVTLCDKSIFHLSYDIYTLYTDKYYSNYARHLYCMLRYISDHSSLVEDKFEYIRILRAQLSIHEAALLYYRAITSKDKGGTKNGNSKYQCLIEETKFMHLLCDDMSFLFDQGLAGRMAKTAFACS